MHKSLVTRTHCEEGGHCEEYPHEDGGHDIVARLKKKPEDMRSVQAELYRLVVKWVPENAKVLIEHRSLLDMDIAFQSCIACACVEKYEAMQRPANTYLDLDKTEKLIRNGRCECKGEHPASSDIELYTGSKKLVHVAAFEGNIKPLTLLASQGCDLNARTGSHFLTPLSIAVDNNQLDIIEFLLSRSADVNFQVGSNQDRTVLHDALLSGRFKAFSLLLKLGNVTTETLNSGNKRGDTVLFLAVQRQDEDCVLQILEAGADVNIGNDRSCTPLMRAATTGNIQIAQSLIQYNALLDLKTTYDMTALTLAASTERWTMIDVLLRAGADPNVKDNYGRCTLSIVSSTSRDDILSSLIDHGACVNAGDRLNYKPIHLAARHGDVNCLRLLLKAGADLDARTDDGKMSLALAADGYCPAAVDFFLSVGCDVNNADNRGDTVLHFAARNNMADSVIKLIDFGADPNCRNMENATPLWVAVYNKKLKVVKVLLSANVEMEVASVGTEYEAWTDDEVPIYDVPRTPLWVSLDLGCPDVARLLVAAGYDLYRENWLILSDFPNESPDNENLRDFLRELISCPPSLLSLCRNRIRKTIRGKKIRSCIDRLIIPAALKSYITLDDVLI